MQDALIQFIRTSIRSVWALEILLHLRDRAQTSISTEQLIKELRSSRAAVVDAMAGLIRAGLASDEQGQFRYRPQTPELDALVAMLQRAYVERPVTVVRLIVETPSRDLQAFADAFRIKKDKE